jgi:hypothetical protein
MTTPTPAFITGPSAAYTSSPLTSLRRDRIDSLVQSSYTDYDADGNNLGGRYCVLATAGADQVVRVADFATLAEADQYITDDPDGLLTPATA